MESTNKTAKFSRRDFLETGATAAAGVAIGAAVGNLLPLAHDDAPPEMVKMLTADGKLVEVEKRRLPPMCGKPVRVSNEAILEWMKEGKS